MNHALKNTYVNCQVFKHMQIFQIFNYFLLIQASAIDFLATYNFDFNKAFYDGILSLSSSQEVALKQKGEYEQYRSALGEYTKFISPETMEYAALNNKIVFFSLNREVYRLVKIKDHIDSGNKEQLILDINGMDFGTYQYLINMVQMTFSL